MGATRAILFTFTTYGTWLRGDARGWVDDGITFPPNPRLEDFDRANLKHDPYYFPSEKRVEVAYEMGLQLKRRLHLRVYAICVQRWHSHVVTGATLHHVSEIAKCAKDAATWFLREGRPIWAADFDKRFCFSDRSARNRIEYVERHNLDDGLPARVVPILDQYTSIATYPPGHDRGAKWQMQHPTPTTCASRFTASTARPTARSPAPRAVFTSSPAAGT